MARIGEQRGVPSRRRTAAFAMAAMLAAAVGLVTLVGWLRAERVEASRIAARAEQLRLERELDEIKEMSAGLQPVVYLGSTTEYDVYIDLQTLQAESAAATPASYRPASKPGV
jgi:hypothetical protein